MLYAGQFMKEQLTYNTDEPDGYQLPKKIF